MTDDVAMTTLPATPVRYRFVSVHRIVGFSELRTIPELLTARELPLDLHMTGVSANLTIDPNQALTEIDRGAALGHLMLLGFFSDQRAPVDLLTAIHEKASGYAQERLKKFGAPGVYLVLEARGDVISTQAEVARDLGGAMFAFDAVDKKALIAPYAPLVSAAVAAVALCVDTTSDVANVADGVELTLPDDRPLYSLTFLGRHCDGDCVPSSDGYGCARDRRELGGAYTGRAAALSSSTTGGCIALYQRPTGGLHLRVGGT